MFYNTFLAVIYDPLYNTLVFLVDTVPYGDVGIAIIILTIIVKTLLFPITKKATETQLALKHIAPKLEELKTTHKDNQQNQVKHMLALYKEHRINPLMSVVTIFIQLPIIIGLYRVFLYGGLPVINPDILYAFVSVPAVINMQFLGFLDLGARSVSLAIIAGLTQFIIAHFSFEAPVTSNKPGASLKDDIMRSMHLQMKYVLPIIVGAFAYYLAAAVALHWAVGNMYTIIQDSLVRRRFRAIKA